MTTPALLPSPTPKSLVKWAIGSVVLVIFALVVLQLLAQRGYDPVGAIARMVPMPTPPPVNPNGSATSANSAAALA